LKESHGATVPEAVRSNPTTVEGRTLGSRFSNGQAESERYAIMTEGRSTSARKNPCLWSDVICRAPFTKQPGGPRPYGDLSIFPTLAVKLDGMVAKLTGTKVEGLGDPSAGVVEQRKKEQISSAGPGILIDGCEDRVDLFAGHETKQRLGAPFLGNGQDTLAGRQEIHDDRLAEHEADERSNRGKPNIARSSAIAAGALQMIEKSEDRLWGEGA